MRHQRNTDAYFDLCDPDRRNGVTEHAKRKIYDIIETLLPKATERAAGGPLLMELFAEPRFSRAGWISLAEE